MRRVRRAIPNSSAQKIADRTLETWIDDGSVRDEARHAATERRPSPRIRAEASASRSRSIPRSRPNSPMRVGKQRGARLAERLAQASEALDRERYQEARRLAGAIAKEAPDVAAAHEVHGLASYRLGMFKPAVRSLEAAFDLHPDPSIMPVIADCYRALGRWSSVDRVWREIREMSPSQEVLAEGRIVAAGALADQGDLRGALAVMEPATKRAKTVRDHHLRQYYVLGDLYDRVGDPIAPGAGSARSPKLDPEFADVEQRLRTLGR